jgi:soluble lytic murein transglycosylase-like protein
MKVKALWALPFVALAVVSGLGPRGITPSVAAGLSASQAQACVYDHLTLRTGPGTCRPRAKAYPEYIKSRVQKAIYDSALTFGIPYGTLLSIARCESGLNPRADSGTHFGLYQFAPATFQRAVRGLRKDTGVEARTYWNSLDASYAAGYMFVTGQASSWACVNAITASTG